MEEKNSLAIELFRLAHLTSKQGYIILRNLDGLKHREIAEELGVSRPYVTQTIKVALRKLRDTI